MTTTGPGGRAARYSRLLFAGLMMAVLLSALLFVVLQIGRSHANSSRADDDVTNSICSRSSWSDGGPRYYSVSFDCPSFNPVFNYANMSAKRERENDIPPPEHNGTASTLTAFNCNYAPHRCGFFSGHYHIDAADLTKRKMTCRICKE